MLQPCKPSQSCVSSAAIRSPAQYLPVWLYKPASRQAAYGQLVTYVHQQQEAGNAEALAFDADQGYVACRLRHQFAGVM